MGNDNKQYYDAEQSEYLNIERDESILGFESLPSSANTTGSIIEAFPADGDASNKKICQFCKWEFTHPSSLGRHLDSKKGDKLHPLDEVNELRSGVKRRGAGPTEKKPPAKKPKLVVTNIQKPSDKNKVRRKLRDRMIKSKILVTENFLGQFGHHPVKVDNFAQLVALKLPASKLSSEHPDESTFQELVNEIRTDTTPAASKEPGSHVVVEETVVRAEQLYGQWNLMSDIEKNRIWVSELTRTMAAVLGAVSLDKLHNVNGILAEAEAAEFKRVCKKDNLLSYIDLSLKNEEQENTQNTE